MVAIPRARRQLLAPEILQISSMDCGPAALKCFLEGSGYHVDFNWLREACLTSVDGTSIDTMEEIAQQVGLDVAQAVVPIDHLFHKASTALPAIAIFRLPSGIPHFVVLWACYGDFVQVMDPASGRRWIRLRQLQDELYLHKMEISATEFYSLVRATAFREPLANRMHQLRIESFDRIAVASQDLTGFQLAHLDAATRMVASLVSSAGVRRGRQASHLLDTLIYQSSAQSGSARQSSNIPEIFWSAYPKLGADSSIEAAVLRGAVLLQVTGKRIIVAKTQDSTSLLRDRSSRVSQSTRPVTFLLRLLGLEGPQLYVLMAIGLLFTALGVILAVVLLRTMVDIGQRLQLPEQRLGAVMALAIFIGILLLLELPLASATNLIGRRLEARMRLAFLEKLPKLDDNYFQGRLISDLTERCHSLYRIRILPALASQAVRFSFEIALTVIGIIWLDPRSAPLAFALGACAVFLPIATQPLLIERDLRVRSHAGILSSFYLESLQGLSAIRSHGAERSVRREHESRLVQWMRANYALIYMTAILDAITVAISFSLAAWLFADHISRFGDVPGALLLVFWALNLPAVGQELSLILRQYPIHRNTIKRLLEPLDEPGPLQDHGTQKNRHSDDPQSRSVHLEFKNVGLVVRGQQILDSISLDISPGQHIAIVGPSGAGKTSLFGLLLGWHQATTGTILIDGTPLDQFGINEMRDMTAWLDPTVHIWNRTLLENIVYGSGDVLDIASVLDCSNLTPLIQNLPHGLQTKLGQSGSMISGGEGQRVRFARALSRPGSRLALLDEPFRGVDRERRMLFLERAHQWFRDSTMVCITHSIDEARTFDRVLVLEGGRIVEAGSPAELEACSDSCFRSLLEAEESVQMMLTQSHGWRRVSLDRGVLNHEGH